MNSAEGVDEEVEEMIKGQQLNETAASGVRKLPKSRKAQMVSLWKQQKKQESYKEQKVQAELQQHFNKHPVRQNVSMYFPVARRPALCHFTFQAAFSSALPTSVSSSAHVTATAEHNASTRLKRDSIVVKDNLGKAVIGFDFVDKVAYLEGKFSEDIITKYYHLCLSVYIYIIYMIAWRAEDGRFYPGTHARVYFTQERTHVCDTDASLFDLTTNLVLFTCSRLPKH
jgi:hypothetical protein